MSEKKTVLVTKVEIGGLGRFGLRLTEVGGAQLANGSVVKVPVALAQSLVERYPAHCKIQGATSPYDFPTEEVAEGFTPCVVGKDEPKAEKKVEKAESPVATEKAKGPSAEGKAANKNIGKAPASKG